VGRRLRKDNYQGNIIHVTLGFGNFEFWGKRKKLGDFIDDGFDVYREAERIIDSELKTNEALKFALLPRSEHKGIRFVGVTMSGLRHNLDQISIFDEVENKKKVLAAVDKINDRFGEFTVERAAIMNTVLQKKTGMVASGLYKRF
jgi:DNA polymerase IV